MKTSDLMSSKEETVGDKPQKARRGMFLGSALAIATGCLCCITPLVLVLFGLASISTAVSVDNTLSGKYIWVFRSIGLLLLAAALVVYFRRRGICTLDAARRQRNRILNAVLLALLFAIGGYLGFEYVLLGYWGRAVGLPWVPEHWAMVWSGILLGVGVVVLLATRWFRGARSSSGGGRSPEKSVTQGDVGSTSDVENRPEGKE
jgi:hypothetical protein